LYVFLWERHLAAMVSWLEATPTRATHHYPIERRSAP
jgi:hypothetical protein